MNLDPISMKKMSIWEIWQYRTGWLEQFPLTPEEQAAADLEKITDDEFFEMLAEGGDENLVPISEAEFMAGLEQ